MYSVTERASSRKDVLVTECGQRMTNSEKPRLKVQIREREGERVSSLPLQADANCMKGVLAAARSSRGSRND